MPVEKDHVKGDELAVKITRFESITALASSFLVSACRVLASHFHHDAGYDKGSQVQLVDTSHALPDGKMLRNVGVFHTGAQLIQHEAFLHAAIDQCDMLLTEEKEGTFFGPCVEYARRRGKKVADIDIFSPFLLECCTGSMPMGALALAGEQFYAEYARARKNKAIQVLHTRRNIFRLLFAAGVAGAIFEGFDHPFATGTDGWQSYFIRGRTAAMFDESRKIIREQKYQNYLLISGDGHARIIEEYFSDPQKFAEDLKKYDTHFKVFGRGAEMVE